MSCHRCASSFGIFNKEKGCPNCGFAYCAKCLKYKAFVPKLGSEARVCKSCYTLLTEGEEKLNLRKEQYSPPAAFLRMEEHAELPNVPFCISHFHHGGALENGYVSSDVMIPELLVRRLESLENPARPPITVYQHDQRMEQLKTGLTSTKDREIVERLQKLRAERKKEPVPSDEEIVRRLSALKDENVERAVAMAKTKFISFLPDTRSDEEKTNDLIKQLLEEQILSAKNISPEDMIASRLAKLRGHDVASSQPVSDDAKVLNIDALGRQGEQDGTTTQGNVQSLSSDELKSLLQQADVEVKEARKKLQADKNAQVKPNSEIQCEEDSSSDEDIAANRTVDRVLKEAALDLKTGRDVGKNVQDGSNDEY